MTCIYIMVKSFVVLGALAGLLWLVLANEAEPAELPNYRPWAPVH